MAQLQFEAIHATANFSEQLVHHFRVAGKASWIELLHGVNQIIDLLLRSRIIPDGAPYALQVRQPLVEILLPICGGRTGVARRRAPRAVLVITGVPATINKATRTAARRPDPASATVHITGVTRSLPLPLPLPWPWLLRRTTPTRQCLGIYATARLSLPTWFAVRAIHLRQPRAEPLYGAEC